MAIVWSDGREGLRRVVMCVISISFIFVEEQVEDEWWIEMKMDFWVAFGG